MPVLNVISKEIIRAEHKYMNTYPPPPPINALVTRGQLNTQVIDSTILYSIHMHSPATAFASSWNVTANNHGNHRQ